MRRFFTLFTGFSLLAAGSGCSMCESPYDCTGPVVDAPYGTPRGGMQYGGNAGPIAPDDPTYSKNKSQDATPRAVAQSEDAAGMKSVVHQPATTASRATPESRSTRPAQ